MSPVLDRASILQFTAAKSLPTQPCDVPQLGGTVLVRTMTGIERDRFEEVQRQVKLANFRGRFAAATLCDAEGTRLFGDGDAETLGNLPSTALDRVYDVASKLNGIGSDVEASAEKN